MPRHAALLGLTIAALAACSTPNAIGPIPNPDPTVASSASVPEEAVTAQGAPASSVAQEPPTTIAAPASAAQASEPATSQSAPEDLTTALTEAMTKYWSARRACSEVPTACDPTTFTAEGELQTRLLAGTKSRVESASYATLSEVTRIEVLKVLSLGDDLVSVTLCEVNGDVLMDSNGTPDRSDDIIRNDLVATHVGEFVVRRSGGAWLPSDYSELSETDGDVPCVG